MTQREQIEAMVLAWLTDGDYDEEVWRAREAIVRLVEEAVSRLKR